MVIEEGEPTGGLEESGEGQQGSLGQPGENDDISEVENESVSGIADNVILSFAEVPQKPSLSDQFKDFGHHKFIDNVHRLAFGQSGVASGKG
jgi:hypothetical protein